MSIAIALVLTRYFLNLSSYSQTLLFVVYTVPVQYSLLNLVIVADMALWSLKAGRAGTSVGR
jgi:hypothetical protein